MRRESHIDDQRAERGCGPRVLLLLFILSKKGQSHEEEEEEGLPGPHRVGSCQQGHRHGREAGSTREKAGG